MQLARKQVLMVVVLIFGTFIAVLDQTLMTPAMASIMREFSVGTATVQWLTTCFTLVNAIMIPVTAYLIERFSTKRLYLTAMGIFAAGSLIAGWGPSFPVLLVGRMIQASGAGILMPLVMTILMLTFPAERRGSAMGIFSVVVAFAPAVGPSIAGFIIDHATWHDMLFIITGLSVLAIVASLFFLQNVGEANPDAHLDKLSVVLSSAGLAGTLYGLATISSGAFAAVDAVLAVGGIALIVWFFFRQLRLEKPMLQVRVLFNRRFLTSAVIAMIIQAALLAGGVLMPIYLQTLRGFSATVSGLVVLPGALLMGALGPVAGRIFDKRGPRVLAVTGTALLTAASIGFFLLNDSTPLPLIIVLYTVRMGAMAFVNMPVTTWGLNALDNTLISHGTSVNNTLRQVAGSFGTAILVSVSSAVTTSRTAALGPVKAGVAGTNAAFLVSAVMCALGFVLVLLFVRGKSTVAAESDPTGGRRAALASVMKRDVYTLPEDATATDAVRLFLDKGISAAPVVDGAGRVTGFVSDGDILRYLSSSVAGGDAKVAAYASAFALPDPDRPDFAQRAAQLDALHVADIATRGAVTVGAHDSLEEVCRVLGENHLKKVPVLDDGALVGVINRSDITRHAMETFVQARGK